MKDFENYLIEIGIHNEHSYVYRKEQLFDNKDYFKKCMNRGLSAYKALLFLHDYINGDYNLDDV